MIAKLIAWGARAHRRRAASRDVAIARMREDHVLGIRTTIPFFLWLMQAEYRRAARHDLPRDRLLVERRGESFSTFTDEESERIAIAAALDAYQRRRRPRRPAGGGAQRWTSLARREGLRP